MSPDSSSVWLVVLLVGYLAPILIASHREHPQLGPISVVNIFLGWTVLGWVIALAWSCSAIDGRT
jgi:hypothetical protein